MDWNGGMGYGIENRLLHRCIHAPLRVNCNCRGSYGQGEEAQGILCIYR